MTPTLLLAFLLPSLTLLGCNNAADLAEKAAEAEADAAAKADYARKQAEEAAALARSAAEAKVSSTDAAFAAMREDYRHQTTERLAELEQTLLQMDARMEKASGKSRSELVAHAATIRENRTAFLKDYEALDSKVGVDWDDARTRLDRDWSAIQERVRAAS